jgi:Haem-degrading
MRIAIGCSLLLVALALPSRDAAAQFAEKKILTLDIARKMVAAAESEAVRNHLAGVVAVVDDGGWLILQERMDHAAYVASVDQRRAVARQSPHCGVVQEAEPGARGRYQPRPHCGGHDARLHKDAGRPSNRRRWRGCRRHWSELRYT